MTILTKPYFPDYFATGFGAKLILERFHNKHKDDIQLRNAAMFGLFLESIRLSKIAIDKYTKHSSFLSGVVGMYCFSQLSRSTVIYFFVRSCLAVYRIHFPGVKIPRTLIFIFIQLIIGHFGNYGIKYMESSYHKFLARITNVKYDTFPKIIKKNYSDCEGYHPFPKNCLKGNLYTIPTNLFSILQTYGIVHTVPILINFQRALESPQSTLINYCTNVGRSTAFLLSYVTVVRAIPCFSRYFFGGHSPQVTVGTWGLCGLFLLLEKSSRRTEFVLYCMAKAIDMMINRVCNTPSNKKLPREREFKTVLFGAALGLWAHSRKVDVSKMKRVDEVISRFV
jgi:hypothetical protein